MLSKRGSVQIKGKSTTDTQAGNGSKNDRTLDVLSVTPKGGNNAVNRVGKAVRGTYWNK